MTKVAIIGAGPCGLSMLRSFEQAEKNGEKIPEIVCFEKQEDWGGLWNYSWRTGSDQYGDPIPNSMYRYLWSNGPKECLEFADYSFDEHFGKPIPSFPPREVLYDYIVGRMSKGNFKNKIKFNTRVISTIFINEKFEISYQDKVNNKILKDNFDYVVVSTGHFSVPFIPEYKGMKSFPGRIMHSHDFRDAEEFRGKNVIVLGSSYSAEDVATLGKIDIKGPDAAELLNRVYTNAWLKLPVGKARYGVMLREDGIVMDDGTTTRISENHYHMTTTTAQAANVLSHLEYYLQLVWPELNVNVVSSTEQWAGAAIAGPKSRDLLQKLFPNSDVSNEGLPFMGYMEGDLFGVKARIFRISFSGELAYEVNVESDNGNFMWEKIIEVGQEFKIQPYGTEALSTLRIEMGHVAGSELDGRTIPYDNSLEGLLSKKKDFIGKRSLTRKAFTADDRQKVVGVVPLDKKTSIPEGSHLVKNSNAPLPNPKLGYISASCWSVEHDNPFSLAILKDGKNMIGEKLFVMSPLKNKVIPVEIVSSHYVDPKGERVRS